MDRMFVSTPPKFIYFSSKPPSVIVLGGGVFGNYLSNDSGALMDEINALIKGTLESSLALYPPSKDITEKTAICTPEEGFHQNSTVVAPLSWTSRFQNCEK